MNVIRSILLIAVMAILTALLRFLPFLVYGGRRKIPQRIIDLGNILPCAIMGMLVVYCLKDVKIFEAPFGIPTFVASLVVVLLHIRKKNSLLSIVGGTAVYMILINFI